ncbi:hypothetical protein [Maribacter antarcticus]|uniref:hypothetical protein n=1 Tax=Maribacter antarcticus TaxID=505250 RepID=UPI000A8F6C23|nr:hypothetical protein [Maribacter antarcticus]
MRMLLVYLQLNYLIKVTLKITDLEHTVAVSENHIGMGIYQTSNYMFYALVIKAVK